MERQVEDDECTPDEMDSIMRFVVENLQTRGTVKEFAEFYGKEESAVRNVLSRNYIPKKDKPTRRVTYRLGFLMSIMPNSWRRENK